MKSKNDNGLIIGIVITVFTIIILGIVILWSSGYFTKNKKTLDTSTGKIDNAIGSLSEFDLDIYDGMSMQGDSLMDLIIDYHNDKVIVAFGVKTLGGTESYYNQGYASNDIVITPTPAAPSFPTAKSDANYINPNGTFVGSVKRNDNDEIVMILFTQQP